MPKQPQTSVGAPKKRDKALVLVSEAMGISLAADVLSLEEMKDFPQLANEKPRAKAIMCLSACGFPQTHIAEAFKVSQPTINEILHRIDPDGRYRVSPDAKKAIITRLAEGIAMSAINSISYENLLELDADKRTSVAQKMIKISQDLNQSKHKHINSSRLDNLLDEMAKGEISEGEIVEEGEISDRIHNLVDDRDARIAELESTLEDYQSMD